MEFYKSEKPHQKPKSSSTQVEEQDHAEHQIYKELSIVILKSLDIKSAKTSQVFFALQELGLNLSDMHKILFWPRTRSTSAVATPKLVTSPLVKKYWVQPLLREMRADFSYADVANILGFQSVATYHHWESGRREIPFHFLLMAMDKFQGRLQAFVDNLPVEIDLTKFESLQLKPKLYQHFFSKPWIPTVILALRLPKLLKMKSSSDQVKYLAEKLNIPREELEGAVSLLMHLQLVKIEEGRLISHPRQFYAIPAITEDKIAELLEYWFMQSQTLIKNSGFHKVEQHATTIESKEKIITWITELREKIKNEVKQSGKPETLIHIAWQVAEIL